MLMFTDGMKFDVSGELHLETRADGPYVIGRGMCIPVANKEEGERLIRHLQSEES